MDNLKDKLEYISAKESNDFVKLREIHEKYSADENGPTVSNVPESPATFETPDHLPFGPSSSKSDANNESCDKKEELTENEKLPSLDNFMHNYTSEDNENFEQLMEETRQKIRLKVDFFIF